MPPGLLIVFGVIAFVVLIGLVGWWSMKKRGQAIRAHLSGLGLACPEKPSLEDKMRVWSRLATPFAKQAWRDGAKGIQWFAEGSIGGLPIVLIEHRYATGAGKSRQLHFHTAACAVGVKGLPRIHVRERHLGDKLAGLFGAEAISIGDEAFEKRFRIFAEGDNALPSAFLTPGLRAWLLAQPKHATGLVTGPEGLTVVVPKMLAKAEEIGAFARKPAEALAALASDPSANLAANLPATASTPPPDGLAMPQDGEVRFGAEASPHVR
jgi:hypothetical protein